MYQKMSIEQEAIEALTEQLTEIQSQEGIAELIQKEYQEIEEWCERIRNGKALEGENEEKGLSYKAKRRFMKMLGVRVTIKPGTSPKGEKYKTIDKDRYEFGIDLPKIQELSSLGQGVKEVGQEDSYQHLGRSSDIDALALASAQ